MPSQKDAEKQFLQLFYRVFHLGGNKPGIVRKSHKIANEEGALRSWTPFSSS